MLYKAIQITMAGILSIKHDRIKPIHNQHPWIFSGAVEEIVGNPQPGEIVTIMDRNARFLARGYYNPKSQIVARLLTWQDEKIDDDWWRRALERAIAGRASFDAQAESGLNTYRLVNAENDYLPGLVVDQYGDELVLQALTLGIDQRKAMLTEVLADLRQPVGIFERSDVDVRGKEGLKPSVGLLWGEEPPETVQVGEYNRLFKVDVRRGHKTGFYLDQRENRRQLADILEDEATHGESWRVLNLFSYTGGFGIYALKGLQDAIAQVVNVDASRDALELAEENYRLNGIPDDKIELLQGDVFDYLRDMRDAGEQFDAIIVDPPKFAQNAGQVQQAARGYKDLNLNAFKLIRPGGLMMTFSCSGAVDADLFQKIVFGALADSGRQAQILRHLGPGDDHPVALTFPEGAYLKGLLLRVY